MDYTVHGILQARILEWIAFSGDLPTPDRTQVSQIAHRVFTIWATREAPKLDVIYTACIQHQCYKFAVTIPLFF